MISKLVKGMKIYTDGREVCRMETKAGRLEYHRRIAEMVLRQGGRCCLCALPLPVEIATFEHQDGRGMGGGRRDDSALKHGKPYNGAAHYKCNADKGSRRINYNL